SASGIRPRGQGLRAALLPGGRVMNRSATRLATILLAAALVWLVAYPLFLVGLESLKGPNGWTLDYFRRFIGQSREWAPLWASIWTSVASVILAGALGIPLAFLFERCEFPGRRLLGALVALPVVLPPLVGVIAFLFLYGETGFVARVVQALLGLS